MDSVRAGLREVSPEAGLIAIHDGARPLVSQEVLCQAIEKAAVTGAAAPAVPVTDTVKRAEDGLAAETIAHCDYTVRIPMSHGVDSLNVAAASAVAFYQLGLLHDRNR